MDLVLFICLLFISQFLVVTGGRRTVSMFRKRNMHVLRKNPETLMYGIARKKCFVVAVDRHTAEVIIPNKKGVYWIEWKSLKPSKRWSLR